MVKIELEEWQVKNLREYFGENDKTQTSHWAYDVFNKALKEQRKISDVRVSLLERAAALVGNPATNISASTDFACDEWQKDYESWCNESRK